MVEHKIENKTDDSKYFTGRILKDLYPDDIGMYSTFKSFTNQKRLDLVKQS